MMNTNFHMNKVFRDQVKVYLKITFGPSTNAHISKILLKDNTGVLALLMFYEDRGVNTGKMFRVLSFVIYTIISKYVCIEYLGSEKEKIK